MGAAGMELRAVRVCVAFSLCPLCCLSRTVSSRLSEAKILSFGQVCGSARC